MCPSLLQLSRRLSVVLLCVSASSFVGCAEETDDGTTPMADAALPPLVLTDGTPDLLLTWFDERGATHTGMTPVEVPEASKTRVRVVTKDAGHGALVYVADLTLKNGDGQYAVRTMPRREWEELISTQRDAYRQKHAPAPAPSGSGSAPEPATPAGVSAVVYGASWCRPCHEAVAYLKRRGINVVEYDIEKEPERASEMQRKLRDAGMSGGTIPVIDVGGVILRGFSAGAIDRALQKAAKSGGTHM